MLRVRLIHGIHSPEGANNMSAFAPHLAKALPEADVQLFEYGFMGFWAARFKNNGVAKGLATLHRVDQQLDAAKELWVTHSNGAAVAFLAVNKYGARPDMIVNINPALDRWRTANVQRVETIHSEQDRAVYVSQWLPGHIWGDQGKVGYKGLADNTRNHNASLFGGNMAYDDHCGAFDPKRIKNWANFVANQAGEFFEL